MDTRGIGFEENLETTLDFPNDKSLEGNNGSFISLMLLLYKRTDIHLVHLNEKAAITSH